MLTDKAKTDFEKWLEKQEVAPYKSMFWDVPIIVQLSYLFLFFGENEIILETDYERNTKQWFGKVIELSKGLRVDISKNYKTEELMKIAAIKEINKIYNT